MPAVDVLLSTLAARPDAEQAAIERELVPLVGAALVGELTADFAHDLANPLLGAAGLVELLRSEPSDDAQLELVSAALTDLKRTLASLLELTRLRTDENGSPVLAEAAQAAVELSLHGARRSRRVERRLSRDGVRVPCRRGLLVQAILQLLLAGGDASPLELGVADATLRLAPAPPDSLATRVAVRILRDSSASVVASNGALTASWSG
jgi:signal transduction histidine kinase